MSTRSWLLLITAPIATMGLMLVLTGQGGEADTPRETPSGPALNERSEARASHRSSFDSRSPSRLPTAEERASRWTAEVEAEFRSARSFPDSSGPFPSGRDPVAQRTEVQRVAGPIGPSGDRAIIWLDRTTATLARPVTVCAAVQGPEGGDRDPGPGTVTVRADRAEASPEVRRDLRAGHCGAATVGTELLLPEGVADGRYIVAVHFGGGGAASTLVQFTARARASLTGRYDDAISEAGDLLVDVEVDVERGGRFWVQASVYTANGGAVGVAQQRIALGPGSHQVTLPFARRLLCPGTGGALEVRRIVLMDVSEVPAFSIDRAENAHVTRAYVPADFGCDAGETTVSG